MTAWDNGGYEVLKRQYISAVSAAILDFVCCCPAHYVGGGFTLIFLKLDFERAVDQQTRARDQTFEGVPDSRCPPVTAGQPHQYLVIFWFNFAKSP